MKNFIFVIDLYAYVVGRPGYFVSLIYGIVEFSANALQGLKKVFIFTLRHF